MDLLHENQNVGEEYRNYEDEKSPTILLNTLQFNLLQTENPEYLLNFNSKI